MDDPIAILTNGYIVEGNTGGENISLTDLVSVAVKEESVKSAVKTNGGVSVYTDDNNKISVKVKDD